MSNDKMREAIIQILLGTQNQSEGVTADAILQALIKQPERSEPADSWPESWQVKPGDESALVAQQPESEPIGEIGLDPNGILEPQIYSDFDITTLKVGTEFYTSPQPSAQVPNGFNRLAYNRKTDEWLYINHAGEWQLCPCPVPQAAQVPEGWEVHCKINAPADHAGQRIIGYRVTLPEGGWEGALDWLPPLAEKRGGEQ